MHAFHPQTNTNGSIFVIYTTTNCYLWRRLVRRPILIVADVINYVLFPIRFSHTFCSRSNCIEQSSLTRNYYINNNSVFRSHAFFHYSPLKCVTGISLYEHNCVLKSIMSTFLLNPYSLPRA